MNRGCLNALLKVNNSSVPVAVKNGLMTMVISFLTKSISLKNI